MKFSLLCDIKVICWKKVISAILMKNIFVLYEYLFVVISFIILKLIIQRVKCLIYFNHILKHYYSTLNTSLHLSSKNYNQFDSTVY